MSYDSVKEFFKQYDRDQDIIVLQESSATVALAAQALNITEGQVAKTLGFKIKDQYALIVTEGNARIDNHKYKAFFNAKAKMMSGEELLNITSHPIGGVCPFGLKEPLSIYLDVSLKQHEWVYPAAGAPNAAIKISVNDLAQYTGGLWINVCK